MKITAVCCTYNRPELLRKSLWMFQQQTHPDKELVILDDANQYDNQEGDNWRLVSLKDRFRSLGEKRNTCASLVSANTEAMAVWDDDDLYFPWALEAHAKTLEHGRWSRPSLCWDMSEEWTTTLLAEASLDGNSYHGAWAYDKEAFRSVGGYPTNLAGDRDSKLGRKLRKRYDASIDPLTHGFDPYYVYCYWRTSVRFNDFKDWNRKSQATPAEIARWGNPKKIGKLVPRAVEDYPPGLSGPRVAWNDRSRYKRTKV